MNTYTDLPPIVILAGGMATRLGALAKICPKAMVEIGGVPFIHYQLTRLKAEGISRVIFCIGHLAQQIKEFVGDGSRFGLRVEYSMDSPDGSTLVGTGGAIRRALHLLPEVFYVTYGDTFLDVSYREVYAKFCQQRGPHVSVQLPPRAMMTVLHNKNRWDKSNIIYRDGKVITYDKKTSLSEMEYIDYGLSLVDKSAFESWVAQRIKQGDNEGVTQGIDVKLDLSEFFSFLVSRGEVRGFPVQNRFYEIGTPESLKETTEYLQKEKLQHDQSKGVCDPSSKKTIGSI